MVLSAEADQGRGNALEFLGAAFSREQVAAEGLKNLDGYGLLNTADIGLGLIGPDDALGLYGSRLIFSQSAMVRPNSARTSS